VQFQDPRSGKPLISDIIIYPQAQSFQGPVNVVSYKRLAHDKQGRLWWLDRHLVARIPFKPIDPRLAGSSADFTIEQFLASLAAEHDYIHFHYAWWTIPKYALLLGGGIGLVVIGLIWPSLLSLLISGGFAPPRDAKSVKQRDSLFYVKSTSTSSAPPPKVRVQDDEQLRQVTAAYEQNLPASEATAAAAASPQPVAEVRKLEGGTLEKAAEVKQEEDDVEVKGEYYPVLIHHKKQSDSKPKS
jgi:hypothetical protein